MYEELRRSEAFGGLLYTGRLRLEAFAASDDFCMRMLLGSAELLLHGRHGLRALWRKGRPAERLTAPKHAERTKGVKEKHGNVRGRSARHLRRCLLFFGEYGTAVETKSGQPRRSAADQAVFGEICCFQTGTEQINRVQRLRVCMAKPLSGQSFGVCCPIPEVT